MPESVQSLGKLGLQLDAETAQFLAGISTAKTAVQQFSNDLNKVPSLKLLSTNEFKQTTDFANLIKDVKPNLFGLSEGFDNAATSGAKLSNQLNNASGGLKTGAAAMRTFGGAAAAINLGSMITGLAGVNTKSMQIAATMTNVGATVREATVAFGGLKAAVVAMAAPIAAIVAGFAGVIGILGSVKQLAAAGVDFLGIKGQTERENEANILSGIVESETETKGFLQQQIDMVMDTFKQGLGNEVQEINNDLTDIWADRQNVTETLMDDFEESKRKELELMKKQAEAEKEKQEKLREFFEHWEDYGFMFVDILEGMNNDIFEAMRDLETFSKNRKQNIDLQTRLTEREMGLPYPGAQNQRMRDLGDVVQGGVQDFAGKSGRVGEVFTAASEGAAAAGIWGAIIAAVMKIVSYTEHFSKVLEYGNTVLGKVVMLFDVVLQPLNSFNKFVTEFVVVIIEIVTTFLKLSQMFSVFMPMFDGVFRGLSEAVQKISGGMVDFRNSIAHFWNAMIEKIAGWLEDIHLGKLARGLRNWKAEIDEITEAVVEQPFGTELSPPLQDLSRAATDAANGLNGFTGVLNAPTGFKYAKQRYDATSVLTSVNNTFNNQAYATSTTQVSINGVQVNQPQNVEALVNDILARQNFTMNATQSSNPGSNNGISQAPPSGYPSSSSQMSGSMLAATSAPTRPSLVGQTSTPTRPAQIQSNAGFWGPPSAQVNPNRK